MTENPINITSLNDFIFCPMSIYFHNLYGETNKLQMQTTYQINGSAVHEAVDNQKYSTASDVLQGLTVYSGKYGLVGKIDVYYENKKLLVERKRQIKKIYDGYVFQLYAQYFSLVEMGYEVDRLQLYSYVDNKKYNVPLPNQDPDMFRRFEMLINEIRFFDIGSYVQDNQEKCENCIYEPACDRSLKEN